MKKLLMLAVIAVVFAASSSAPQAFACGGGDKAHGEGGSEAGK